MKKFFLFLVSTFFLYGCQNDLTGRYSGFGSDGSLFSVVLVEATGKLQGRYQHLWIDHESIREDDGLIEATESNGQISGLLKPAAFFSQNIPLSGFSDGKTLFLSGQASISSVRLSLNKTNEEKFKEQLKALNKKVEYLKIEFYVNKIKDITQKESDFLSQTVGVVARISSVEKFWYDTTYLMAQQAQEELSIQNYGNKYALASKIQNENLHSEKERREMEAFQNALLSSKVYRSAIDLAQGCHQAHNETANNPVLEERKNWNNACLSMYQVFDRYMERIEEIKKTLNIADSVWATEHPKQLKISEDAFHL